MYPLSLAQWLFGSPTLVQALGCVGPSGVDEDAAFQLRYPGGVSASFFVSIRAWAPNTFHVMGTEGMIGFHGSVVRPHGLEVMRQSPLRMTEPAFGLRSRIREHGFTHRLSQIAGVSSRSAGQRVNYAYRGNGFHYEAEEVRACIERGARESAVMPLSDSIAVATTADAIREAILKPPGSRNSSV